MADSSPAEQDELAPDEQLVAGDEFAAAVDGWAMVQVCFPERDDLPAEQDEPALAEPLAVRDGSPALDDWAMRACFPELDDLPEPVGLRGLGGCFPEPTGVRSAQVVSGEQVLWDALVRVAAGCAPAQQADSDACLELPAAMLAHYSAAQAVRRWSAERDAERYSAGRCVRPLLAQWPDARWERLRELPDEWRSPELVWARAARRSVACWRPA